MISSLPTGGQAMKVIVTGASGMLGEEIADTFEQRPEWTAVRWHGSSDVDVADREAVIRSALSVKPDLVVHTAAIRDIETCEANPASAVEVNAFGAQNVALATSMCDCPIVHISTDFPTKGARPGTNTRSWSRDLLECPILKLSRRASPSGPPGDPVTPQWTALVRARHSVSRCSHGIAPFGSALRRRGSPLAMCR